MSGRVKMIHDGQWDSVRLAKRRDEDKMTTLEYTGCIDGTKGADWIDLGASLGLCCLQLPSVFLH